MGKTIEEAEVKVTMNGEEAHKKLNELVDTANALKIKLAEAEKNGQKIEADKIKKDLKETNQQIDEIQETMRNINYMITNIDTYTPKELQKYLRDINKELSSGRVLRGSEQWQRYSEAAARAKEQLKVLKEEMTVPEKGLLETIAGKIDQYWASYTVLTDITDRMNQFTSSKVKAYAQMQEAMAQVTKYTGMTTEQVKDLNEAFKAMDTRTSREQLNALAGDAGRLGIQTKEAVLEFVDAADKINVSLGDELGADAVKNIGKLAMMFGEDKRMGLRGAMLATGSAVNEVAQNCSAAEGFLVDFTARVAAAANQANISQADIIGFAASMDENMLQDETSATAYQKILLKMFTKTEKFAAAAGIEVEKFSELLKTDANEALLQFAEGLSKKGGLADLAPIFGDLKTEGAGVSTVLSVLAGKADEIRARQELANQAYNDGTSIINEFNVQNNTVLGGLEKAQKRFNDLAVELGERLNPIMQSGLHLTSKFIKLMTATLDFVTENKAALVALGATMLVATQQANAYNTVIGVKNALTKLLTQTSLIYHAAQLRNNAHTKLANELMQKNAEIMVMSTARYRALTVVTQAWTAVVAVCTGRLKQAKAAILAMNAAMNINPVVAVTTAITALAGALYWYFTRTTQAQKAMKAFNAENAKEQTTLNNLYIAIKDANKGTEARKKLIDEFNSKYGKYIDHLLTEKSTVEDLAAAYRKASLAIQDNIARKQIDQSVNEIVTNHSENKGEYINDFTDALKSKLPASTVNSVRQTMMLKVQEMLDQGTDIDKITQSIVNGLSNQYSKLNAGDLFDARKAVKNYAKELKKEMEEIAKAKKKFSGLLIDKPAEESKTEEDTTTSHKGTQINAGDEDDDGETGGESETDKARKARVQAALKEEKAKYYDELRALQEQYLSDSTMSQEEYNAQLEQLEMDHLKRQLEIAGMEPDKIAEIQEKIMQIKLKQRQEQEKKNEQAKKDAEAKQKEAQETYLSNAEKQYQLDIENEMRRYINKEETTEEYQKALEKLENDFWERMSKDENLSDKQRAAFSLKMENKKTEGLKTEAQKRQSTEEDEKKQREANAKELTSSIQSIWSQFYSGESQSLDKFLAATLTSVVDSLEKQLMAEQAAAIAKVTIKNISLKGMLGLAASVAETAAIAAAFEGAKALLSNLWTGGYTEGGEWNEPKGIVHSNEFVANRFAVGNPQVRPVLDLINAAQRQNTVSSLTAADISRVLPSQQGNSQAAVNVVQTTDPELKAVLLECRSTIAAMQKKLEEPIFTYTRASGKFGVNEAQELNKKLKANASR